MCNKNNYSDEDDLLQASSPIGDEILDPNRVSINDGQPEQRK